MSSYSRRSETFYGYVVGTMVKTVASTGYFLDVLGFTFTLKFCLPYYNEYYFVRGLLNDLGPYILSKS